MHDLQRFMKPSAHIRVVRWALAACALVCLLIGTHATAADAVTTKRVLLQDGSILVGVVQKSTPTTLWFKTSAGVLKIERSKIKRIEASPVARPAARIPAKPTKQPAAPANDNYDPDDPDGTTTKSIQTKGKGSGTKAKSPQVTKRRVSQNRYRRDRYGRDRDSRDRYDRDRDQRYRDNYRRRRYRRGQPLYYRTRNSRRGFLIAGISMLSSGYGVSLFIGLMGTSIASSVGDSRTALDFGMLMVPVAGPFLTWALIAGRGTPGAVVGTYPFLALLGLVQGLGLTFVILGATGKKTRYPVYAKKSLNKTQTAPPKAPPLPLHAQHLGTF